MFALIVVRAVCTTVYAAAFVFFLAVCSVISLAQTSQNTQAVCAPLDRTLVAIEAQFPIKSAVKLDDVQSAAVIALYSGVTGDLVKYTWVVLLTHTDGRVGVLFGNDDDVCAGGMVVEEAVPSLMRAIVGDGV
jgi:hypothetical protein